VDAVKSSQAFHIPTLCLYTVYFVDFSGVWLEYSADEKGCDI